MSKQVCFVSLNYMELIAKLEETNFAVEEDTGWELYNRFNKFSQLNKNDIYVSAYFGDIDNNLKLLITQGVQAHCYIYDVGSPVWEFFLEHYPPKVYNYWNGYNEQIIAPYEIEDRFSEQVHQKIYNRLSYAKWEKIFRNKDIEYLHLYYVSSTQAIKVIPRDEEYKKLDEFDFSFSDSSFGQFLYNEYFREFNDSREKDYLLQKAKAETTYVEKKKDEQLIYLSSASSSFDDTYGLTYQGNEWNSTDTNGIYINTGSERYSLTDTLKDLKAQVDDLQIKFNDYNKEINDMTVYKDNSVKDTKNSLAKSFNLDIGTCENDNVKMSPYGLAIKNMSGTWVSYDAKTGSIMDVEILNFDCGKFLFKMPVAVDQIKAGDVIIHNRTPVFVKTTKGNQIEAVDIFSGSVQVIIPTKNMFNFNFVTKVVSLVDFTGASATAENPFGNILPFMLLADGNSNGSDLLPLMFMNGNAGLDMSNPLMIYALCGKDSKMGDILPMMLLSQSMNGAKTPTAAN